MRKQLSGTEGIAEVSGWGGYVKQYEVAIDADRLNVSGLTVADVYEALEAGNENTGGSYIEKNSKQYFIRGIGLATSLEDIGKIPVKTIGGTPILVRDVADVQFGYATRYGAVTRNGEGEVVAGITLMLKGENFQQVIKNVKERMALIQKSLPEGVIIEPFIDRTQLVDRVTGTITRNLIEGGLIVVFILVLFLGNYRAGLVVASVIPLSMLSAFDMMRLFGVSDNLMSLGAIDFGLIVDGAVIIVEAVCHHIGISKESTHKRNLSDRLVEKLRGWYLPVITKSLNWSKTLIASMVVLFAISLLIFNRLGGEFIPSLEEGDFAAEISMEQGTSLSQMGKAPRRRRKS